MYFFNAKHYTDVYPDQSVFNVPKECENANVEKRKLKKFNFNLFNLQFN
jgi:arabinogalactan endo-1,4-beta-galactosidase